MTIPHMNWTCDPENHQANRSPEFNRIRDIVAGIIATNLRTFFDAAEIKSPADLPSQLGTVWAPHIVAQLTHAHDFSPIHMTSGESSLLGAVLSLAASPESAPRDDDGNTIPLDLKGFIAARTARNELVDRVSKSNGKDYGPPRTGLPPPDLDGPGVVREVRWTDLDGNERSEFKWSSQLTNFCSALEGIPFIVNDAPEGFVIDPPRHAPDDDLSEDLRVPTADLAIYFRDRLAKFLP